MTYTPLTDDEVKAIAAMTVADATAKLPGLSADDLNRVRAAEMAGSARKTLTDAIDRATGDALAAEGNAARSNATATSEAELLDKVDAKASAPALPVDLSDFSLDTLQAHRALLTGEGNEDELARVDRAIDDLRERAKAVPEIDPGSTKTRTVETRAALDAVQADGGLSLRFVDKAGADVAPEQMVDRAMFTIAGSRPLFQRPLAFRGTLDPGELHAVLLVDGDDEIVSVCEVPKGLPVGGGREAEIPAGHLIF